METWRAVPDWEGVYEVSSLGRVRSLDRVVRSYRAWGEEPTQGGWRTREHKGRVLKQQVATNGYLKVSLTDGDRRVQRHTHVLVCLAFIGPCPNGKQVGHKDGDKENNARANLRYVSALLNAKDRDAHGTTARGTKHWNWQGGKERASA